MIIILYNDIILYYSYHSRIWLFYYPSRFSWIMDPFCKPGMRQDGPPNIRISQKIQSKWDMKKKNGDI